jgi:hypothetical protein
MITSYKANSAPALTQSEALRNLDAEIGKLDTKKQLYVLRYLRNGALDPQAQNNPLATKIDAVRKTVANESGLDDESSKTFIDDFVSTSVIKNLHPKWQEEIENKQQDSKKQGTAIFNEAAKARIINRDWAADKISDIKDIKATEKLKQESIEYEKLALEKLKEAEAAFNSEKEKISPSGLKKTEAELNRELKNLAKKADAQFKKDDAIFKQIEKNKQKMEVEKQQEIRRQLALKEKTARELAEYEIREKAKEDKYNAEGRKFQEKRGDIPLFF